MLWVRVLILGLGFFGISAVWPIYQAYMPRFYSALLASYLLTGVVMGIDNLFGLTIQPYFGALSDQTRTRFGRRIPYLLIGMPVAAVFLFLLPYGKAMGLVPLLLLTIVLNIAMAIFRSPTVALMPDVVPSHMRSQANGIINFMGGLGYVAALQVTSTFGARSEHLPFAIIAGLLVAVALIFLVFIRERRESTEQVDETPRGLADALRSFVRVSDRQVQLMIAAIFLWTLAKDGVDTFFSSYAVEVLGLTVPQAAGYQTYMGATFLLLAIPFGFLSAVTGRRRAMALGAVLMAAGVGVIGLLGKSPLLIPALVVTGMGWAFIIVNAYPGMVEMAANGQTGTFTGIYYIGAGVAGWIAPAIFGFLRDLVGWTPTFVLAVVLFAAAAVTVLQVTGADARPKQPKTRVA